MNIQTNDGEGGLFTRAHTINEYTSQTLKSQSHTLITNIHKYSLYLSF
jgi:hypothetical protein